MSWAFGVLGALAFVALLALVFVRANPARLAAQLRIAGPVALGLAGLALVALGRTQIGFLLLSGAGSLWYLGRGSGKGKPSSGRRSSVRTAALEMELDHDTGALDGVVLAGRFEGRQLAALDESQLQRLMADLASDPESVQLLETYLDGRFPGWRDDAEPDLGAGQGGAPGPGAMTHKEAYQILGLEAGASPAEIRQAHRRLMQRLHPDLGGSSFLAARINEAKDLLLSLHD